LNYIGNIYPPNFYYPKYEEFHPPEFKYESDNKEESTPKVENKNEISDKATK